jgi:hypothetical protein
MYVSSDLPTVSGRHCYGISVLDGGAAVPIDAIVCPGRVKCCRFSKMVGIAVETGRHLPSPTSVAVEAVKDRLSSRFLFSLMPLPS